MTKIRAVLVFARTKADVLIDKYKFNFRLTETGDVSFFLLTPACSVQDQPWGRPMSLTTRVMRSNPTSVTVEGVPVSSASSRWDRLRRNGWHIPSTTVGDVSFSELASAHLGGRGATNCLTERPFHVVLATASMLAMSFLCCSGARSGAHSRLGPHFRVQWTSSGHNYPPAVAGHDGTSGQEGRRVGLSSPKSVRVLAGVQRQSLHVRWGRVPKRVC